MGPTIFGGTAMWIGPGMTPGRAGGTPGTTEIPGIAPAIGGIATEDVLIPAIIGAGTLPIIFGATPGIVRWTGDGVLTIGGWYPLIIVPSPARGEILTVLKLADPGSFFTIHSLWKLPEGIIGFKIPLFIVTGVLGFPAFNTNSGPAGATIFKGDIGRGMEGASIPSA